MRKNPQLVREFGLFEFWAHKIQTINHSEEIIHYSLFDNNPMPFFMPIFQVRYYINLNETAAEFYLVSYSFSHERNKMPPSNVIWI